MIVYICDICKEQLSFDYCKVDMVEYEVGTNEPLELKYPHSHPAVHKIICEKCLEIIRKPFWQEKDEKTREEYNIMITDKDIKEMMGARKFLL